MPTITRLRSERDSLIQRVGTIIYEYDSAFENISDVAEDNSTFSEMFETVIAKGEEYLDRLRTIHIHLKSSSVKYSIKKINETRKDIGTIIRKADKLLNKLVEMAQGDQ
jgi:hypothetical protein